MRKVILAFFTVLATLFTACALPAQTGIITPKEAMDMIEKHEDTLLLDVRTPEEYREKRIPGSVLLPDYEVKDKISELAPDKSTRIIVYCRSGRRSASAVKTLMDLGYENVYDLGGINNWPYETISGD
jgi:rhodanese-related sulfurtransferase